MIFSYPPDRFQNPPRPHVYLEWYDRPICLLMWDKTQAYLVIWVDSSKEEETQEWERWLCIPVTPAQAQELQNDHETSYAVIARDAKGPFLITDVQWKPNVLVTEKRVKREDVPEDYWPTDWPEEKPA